MTAKMTAAGLDPSRIQERAEILAKAQGAARKRKRDETESAMDVDMEGEGEGGEDDWMDVDGGEGESGGTPKKKRKANSGVVAKGKHTPATNRQLAGMRDAAVRALLSRLFLCLTLSPAIHSFSKRPKPSGCATYRSESATGRRKPARAIVRSKQKWYVALGALTREAYTDFLTAETSVRWEAEGRQDRPEMSGVGWMRSAPQWYCMYLSLAVYLYRYMTLQVVRRHALSNTVKSRKRQGWEVAPARDQGKQTRSTEQMRTQVTCERKIYSGAINEIHPPRNREKGR